MKRDKKNILLWPFVWMVMVAIALLGLSIFLNKTNNDFAHEMQKLERKLERVSRAIPKNSNRWDLDTLYEFGGADEIKRTY